MSLTRSIDSEPHDDGGLSKRWTVASDAGSVALSLTRGALALDALDALSTFVRAQTAPAGDGEVWVFGAVRVHEPTTEPVFGCPLHEGCEMDSIVSSYTRPAWDRIRAAGVTDEAIWAELEALHRDHFPPEGEAAA